MSECMTQEDAMNMSDEQAVQILKPFRDMMIDQNGCPISDAVFALDKAIVALKREERKKGKWILVHEADETGNATYECSICHRGEVHVPIVEVAYCWHCGARMEQTDD